jgi:hypothetical protein
MIDDHGQLEKSFEDEFASMTAYGQPPVTRPGYTHCPSDTRSDAFRLHFRRMGMT